MHWINFLKYEVMKRKNTRFIWLSMLFFILWIGLLYYFSHLWTNPLERQLNDVYLKAYFIEQSGYLAYFMIGFHMIVSSIDWLSEKKAYLEVMFNTQYVVFKLLQFWLETMMLVIFYGMTIQLIYGVSFNDYAWISSLWIKLSLNACVLSGFVVLWLRVKSTYGLLFGLLVLIIYPNVNSIFGPSIWIDTLIPFNQGIFRFHPIWLTFGYYWISFLLCRIKPK